MQVFDELRKDRPLATMIFVGVKPAYYPWLLQVQEDFQADGVTLKGSMSYAEVLRHLDGSKVGINYHPLGRRFHTAIPNKVLEYMARGLLTVSTDLPELRKLLGEVPGVTLASSTSPRLYAQAARNFLELPQEEVARIKLAMLGRVKEGLTWEVRAEPQLLDLYRRLMEEACAS
jgi:glycosyltransferase involved in cell wall biosynthesis